MSTIFIGEIRMFAGNFAPAGWMFCEGQLLPISDFETLFQILGTTYGGDGQSTFALPDMRGRIPIHQGNGFILAETGGAETITLTVSQLPAHSHSLMGSSNNASTANAGGNVLAQTPTYTPYISATPNTALAATSGGAVGGNQPHNNFQPYLCVNFIIAVAVGIFPTQS